MKTRVFITLLGMFFLASCATSPNLPVSRFQLEGREYLYGKREWEFKGRGAVSNEIESFSFSISWWHRFDEDEIELAGPFGQGRTIITVSSGSVYIDFGDKKIQFIDDVDEQVAKYTGVLVPFSALKYWVIGLTDPKKNYDRLEKGFLQSDWIVKYEKMHSIGSHQLPQKIKIERVRNAEIARTKLKLVIDRWDIK